MYVISTPILLLPFAGCQSAFSQNHSQNVNEVLLTWGRLYKKVIKVNYD